MNMKKTLSLTVCILLAFSSVNITAMAQPEPIVVNISKGDTYTLPANIQWNEGSDVDTSNSGYQLFTGIDENGAPVTYRVNVGEYKALMQDDFESYTEAQYTAKIDRQVITGGTFYKAAYSANADNGASQQLVKDGENTVASFGKGLSGIPNFVWTPTDTAPGEDFSLSYNLKIASFDITEAGDGTHYFFTNSFGNTEGIHLRAKVENGAVTATELRCAGVRPANFSIADYITWHYKGTSNAVAYMDEYVNIRICGNKNTYSVKINGETVAKDIQWTNSNIYNGEGVGFIIWAKRNSSTAAITYADDMIYSKPIYPVGNVPDSINAAVEPGTTGSAVSSFNLKMSDGSFKSVPVSYTLKYEDTKKEGVIIVNGRAEGFNFDIPVTVSVENAPVKIESIENLSKKVSVGEAFTLPETVTASMSDGSSKEVAITWDGAANTENKGVYTFTGVVDGYSKTVIYTLTVEAKSYINIIAGIGDAYSLPDSYNGNDITWDTGTAVDTSLLGRQIFTGSLSNGDAVVCTVNIGEQNVLISEDMESYTVGGEKPDFETAGGAGGLSLTGGNDIVYEEGAEDNKVAQVSDSTSWGSFKLIAPERSKYDYIITGRWKQISSALKSGATLVAYNDPSLGRLEVCGMRVAIDAYNGKLNVINGIKNNISTGANPEAAQLKGRQFDDWTNKWINFSILVDKNKGTYSVFANGYDIRLNVPFNQTAVTDPSFKVIEIVGTNGEGSNGETVNNQTYFDDLKVTEYRYVTGDLPEILYDSVTSGISADRFQYIPLKMNDGTTQQFKVKYTIDPTQSGKQTVTGKIDGFSETIEVVVDVDSRIIESIKPESLENTHKVYVGSEYTLPATVIAVMSDTDENGSNEKEMSVIWNTAASTAKAGVFTYTGTVSGYEGEVLYTLTVSEDRPVSAETIEKTVTLNESYKFPETAAVTMESGITKYMKVNWGDNIAKTDVVGEKTYTGYIVGYPEITGGDGIIVTLKLIVEASSIAAAGYREGKSSFDIILKDISELPKKVGCVYENGKHGFEPVKWDTSSIGEGTGPFRITGVLSSKDLSAGFDGVINANVSFYNVPAPALEDGLDTFKWPFGDDMFPVGVSLKYKQYPVNNSRLFMCIQDPDNPENKILKYENNPKYDSNETKVYSGLAMNQHKGGFLVAESDIKLPGSFNYTRFRLLTGMSREFFVMDLYGNRSMKIRNIDIVENAFPLDEWFKLTIAADTTSSKAEDRYCDIYINGIHLCRAPWYQDPSETNGVGEGVKSFDFRNDTDDNYLMYLDNVKLYFLNDLMEDAYAHIESIDPVIKTDKIDLKESIGNTAISWSSSDEGIIAPDGTVTRPAYNSSNQDVTLTAALSQQAGIFKAGDTVTKSVQVMKVGISDAELVNEAKKSLNSIPGETSTDITLPADFGGAKIAWTTSDEKLIDVYGRVYPVESDTTVTLTAIITAGNVSDTKTIAIKVLHTETLTDLQRVRKVMKSINLPATVSQDISLPSSMDGVIITWVSKSLSVIASDGSLNKNRPSSAQAVLTAVFMYGNDISETKDYSLTVTKSSTEGAYGGGGGGGSKSDYIQKTPAKEVPVISEEKFSDLAGYEWAKTAVEALSDMGIINGIGNKSFAPSNNIKREEFAAMIVRLAKIEQSGIHNPFSDVNESDWFTAELSAAFKNGIINGMGDGTFGAGKNITRQDMAVILFNLAKRYGIDTKDAPKSEFRDYSNISEYATEAIDFLAGKGIINGTDGNMLPRRMATRAEAAKMIYEFIKVLDIENMQLLTENTAKQAQ